MIEVSRAKVTISHPCLDHVSTSTTQGQQEPCAPPAVPRKREFCKRPHRLGVSR